jgi:uncharacterized membrane protein
MAWHDYIDFGLIQLNARHVSGALVSILGFSLVTMVSSSLIETGWVLSLIHLTDNLVVSCCILYLGVVIWELVGKLAKRAKGQKWIGTTLLGCVKPSGFGASTLR